MINWFLQKIIGTQNERELKRLRPRVAGINALEPGISKLTNAELRAKVEALRRTVQDGLRHVEEQAQQEETAGASGFDEGKGESAMDRRARLRKERRKRVREVLDGVLVETFALVREASKRTTRMRHFDVQMIGGMVLHEGKISEMATGEGKTLVATLAATLNALTGRGVHVVTVNDYLARRDRMWMGPIYELLGLSVGAIQHDLSDVDRKLAYGCDITYGTNNELGFDYLRDNMKYRTEDQVLRGFHYAIVDEVDSILVDEARTPLIISGPAEESTDLYYRLNQLVPKLTKETHFQVDEKGHAVSMTEDGVREAEQLLGVENLYDDIHNNLVHHLTQALTAHQLYALDVDYMIKDGEIVIVDEFTGRLMPGRRWSDGLHQAIEAKEGVRIRQENQTLATVTFQNYFRMYDKLAGMTGTAATEATEFKTIYGLDVVTIPTNRPLIRTNHPDMVYKTEQEKFHGVVEEIVALHQKGQPVLVGTISIEKSERLSGLLKRRGVPHSVLNAKYHEMEAHIIAQAGRRQGVTIATNMAGRGTDILLGGNADFLAEDQVKQVASGGKAVSDEERQQVFTQTRARADEEHQQVVGLGGLHVLGTERHEARRIDNQLRGRCGRQGDPGSSRFYLSFEDDLMRIFGADRIKRLMESKLIAWEENMPLEHGMVTKSIEIAQKRVEAHNFAIRRELLEYDNVMNRQREVIYEERQRILEGRELERHAREMLDEVVADAVDRFLHPQQSEEAWDVAGLAEWARSQCGLVVELPADRDQAREQLGANVQEAYTAREQELGVEQLRMLERRILLDFIDVKWKDHLYAMDALREGIGLRAYGQRDPKVEYAHEAFTMFEEMVARIKEEAVEFLFKVRAVREEPSPRGVFNAAAALLLHPESERFIAPPMPAGLAGLPERLGLPFGGGGFPRGAPVPPQSEPSAPVRRTEPKIGRNDPCHCGSGKKYKKCHGQSA